MPHNRVLRELPFTIDRHSFDYDHRIFFCCFFSGYID